MCVCVCQCILELCEEAFIESCFEELFEEEDRFAEELQQYLSSLTQEQVGSLVNQLDAVSIDDSQTTSDGDVTTKVCSTCHFTHFIVLSHD